MFWGYNNLAQHLDPDQPVYGFKSKGLEGAEEHQTIPEMAAAYVRELRQLQPHGPYYVGGYCFGGNVAFEMARQLEAAGEQIGLLMLFNCAPPNSRYLTPSFTPTWWLRFARNLFYWAGYMRSWTPSQRTGFLKWKWSTLRSKLRRHQASVAVNQLVDLSSYSPEQQKVWEAHIRALVDYRPGVFGGKARLFRSPGHPLWCSFDPDYGWRDYLTGNLEVTVVPGAHEKILEEPCVRTVAAALNAALSPPAQAAVEAPLTHSGAASSGQLAGSPAPDLPAPRRVEMSPDQKTNLVSGQV
jgi:thioesterase domain-containing protein